MDGIALSVIGFPLGEAVDEEGEVVQSMMISEAGSCNPGEFLASPLVGDDQTLLEDGGVPGPCLCKSSSISHTHGVPSLLTGW